MKQYSWTFKFHKVIVRQQYSGAVEDFVLRYSAVYLRIQKWKNYWNRSTFVKVIIKIKVAPFFSGPRCRSLFWALSTSKMHLRSGHRPEPQSPMWELTVSGSHTPAGGDGVCGCASRTSPRFWPSASNFGLSSLSSVPSKTNS